MSERGPMTSWPIARPMRVPVSVSCTAAEDVFRSSTIEVGFDIRQRRQIHVDGQRTESDQRPEDQDDPQTFGRGGFSAGLGGRLVERTSGRCDCLFGGMRHQQDSNRTDGYVPGVMYSS